MASQVSICRQCNGTGKWRGQSYEVDIRNNTVFGATSGGLTCPPNNEAPCNGCIGTGFYNSFGN